MADDGEMDGDALTRGGGEGGGEEGQASMSMSRVKRSRRVIKSTSRSHTVNLTYLQQRRQASEYVSDDDDTVNGVYVDVDPTVTPLSTAANDCMTTESNNNNNGTESKTSDDINNEIEDYDDFYDESYEGEWAWPGDEPDDAMRGEGDNDVNDSGSDDYFDAEEGDYVNTILESTDSAVGGRRRVQQRLNSGDSDSSEGRRSHLYEEVNLSVDSASSEHTKRDKVYYVCNELLQTEAEYVRRIEVLVKTKDLAAMLFDADVAKNMFRDIDTILSLHKNELLPKLKQRLENWDSCPAMGDIMSDFAPCLKLYSRYVANFEKAIEMVNSYEAKYPEFKKYAKELVTASKMHGLKVQSFMLEPVQRVPRYELLMKDYLKKLPETSTDRAKVEIALELIHQAASHYETEMKKNSDMSRLLALQAEMEGPVNLLDSHREFLKQGPVTLHRAKDDKLVDRTAFLFSDLLLICQDTLLGLKAKYKVKHIVHLATAKISDGSNEKQSLFLIRTTHFVLEFRFSTEDTMKGWYDGISQQIFDCRAKNKMRRRRSVKRGSVTNQTGNFATRNIGKRAPILVHAQDVRQCAVCSTVFKRMVKKHHCEACGQVVCAHCCNNRMELEYAPGEKKRVCDRCHWLLQRLAKQHSGGGGGGGVSRNISTSSSTDSIPSAGGVQLRPPRSSDASRLHPRVRPRQSLPAISSGRVVASTFYDEAIEPEETELSANQNCARESRVTRASRSMSQADYYEEVVIMPRVKSVADKSSNSQEDRETALPPQELKKEEEREEIGRGQQLKRGFSQCLIRGRLRLSLDSGKTWRHLLCVLRDSSMLQAYADPEDIKPCLTIPMKNTICSEFILPLNGTSGQLQVNADVPCLRLVLYKTAKEFLLQPEDKQQLVAWRKALTAPSSAVTSVSASLSQLSFNATSVLVSAPLRLELAAASGVC